MSETINVLYLSYDGMTDPLGQSQVLPYLTGLSERGCTIHLISFEKKERFPLEKETIQRICQKHNITWHPLSYTKKPPIISTLIDIRRMSRLAKKLHKKSPFHIVHARSYISAFVALEMKKKWGTGFLFDMRGFYPDERVDGGIWNLNNFIYKLVYNYFKKVEHKFLLNADHIISLTHAGKKILKKYPGISRNMEEDITVIPCCVDTEHFNSEKEICNPEADKKWICYVGSLGTWYLLEDMVKFMSHLHKTDPSWNWLILTRDSHDELLKFAAKHNLPQEAIQIKAAGRAELPTLLSTCEASIFFIKSTFSKQASSPTKQGEVMAMGLPIICNAGVGDSDAIVQKWNAGVILKDLSDESITNAVNEWLKKAGTFNPSSIRTGAIEVFSLAKGVASYFKIYRRIVSENTNKSI